MSNENKNASALPLFYTNPEPLDAKRHANLALRKNFGLGFTKGVNAVPITMIELPQICHAYPIAFSPDANATPVAILGLRDNENLFVNDKGEWAGDIYIPSYIRRYPFIFSEQAGGDQLTLCIDMTDTVTEDNGEQKFFEADGQPTALAKNALEFCKSYHSAAQQTLAFGKDLHEAGLLVERSAEIVVPGGQKINFSGFRIIDEEKLSNLDEKTFLDFRKKGWLPFIYAHLFSGAQWPRLTRQLNDVIKKAAN
ncbi:MAG TPA: sapC family protein [Rhodospirillaceae bacterium]|nr:sapC family protein [Rhodospirillaceae bacterium]